MVLAGVVGVLVLAVFGASWFLIANHNDSGGGSKSGSSKSGSSTGPRETGELRLPGDDPLTLDPALVTDVGSAVYVVELFGGLVSLDKSLKVVPDIAKEWTIS